MHAQRLAQELRYEIARGAYKPGERLPAIRDLARRLGVSPRIVHQAYRELAQEGWIALRVGRGAVVLQQQPTLSKAERLERGAAVLEQTLRQLIPLGLSAREILHLLEEQLTYEAPEEPTPKVLYAAPGQEEAQLGAEALLLSSGSLHPILPVRLEELSMHPDAERVFCALADLHLLRAQGVGRATGLLVGFARPVLEAVAELGPQATLGLVAQERETLARYADWLRTWTGFRGAIVGLLRDHEDPAPVLARCDLVLYTPACLRPLRPYLDRRPAILLRPQLLGWSPGELQALLGGL
ncbi:MAG: GntR family transcriptional regulator [Bacteroidetes bacterium]|nr:GntR family transcriptional regulator [Rhodothermia bacterium]MCS7154537.1 GntR family transcriptional regulator [Bacteroidota bacterium]MCX7906254.1 GntR family transcriptional regulator [Bacteroidota bacterium]MDW8137330.1 GntR family transcriptional regulator [Bacteroidota bacterium]MDW8285716.1 GntR family transcriptional regulator [Bacteroidota bacterium]